MASYRHRVSAGCAVVLLILCLDSDAQALEDADVFAGRHLSEALRILTNRGLRIVFSSETVTPSMRVAQEPPQGTPRQILEFILKPHSLAAEEGPGGIIQIVRSRSSRGSRAGAVSFPSFDPRASEVPAYSERVHVTAPELRPPLSDEPGRTLSAADLQTLSGLTTGDPLRAMQALPGVTPVGDFHSEFSVRGSPARHVGVVIDGVAMPWVRHQVYGRHDMGSVALLNPDVIQHAALLAGTYPLRHHEHLGAELQLALREGSRTSTRGSATVGGTSSTILAEGPIGGAARSSSGSRGPERDESRGSWLVAARQSHRDWPLRRQTSDGSVFGFTDAHARVVYDPWRGQQISVTWVGGRTGGEGPDAAAPGGLAHANTMVSLLNAAWRSAPGDSYVFTQRISSSSRGYWNKYPSGEDFVRGADRSIAYRADLVRSVLGGILDTGGEVERVIASRRIAETGAAGSSAWQQSVYGSFARTVSALSVRSGVRATHSTLIYRPAVSRWLLTEWRPDTHWTLTGSTSSIAQVPALQYVLESQAGSRLQPERATKVDVAIERRIGETLRVRAGLFGSREHDLLLWKPAGYLNMASRSSRGIEVTVARRRTAGLSGWIAYAFGESRETDELQRQTYWSAFDQRHALNIFARYEVSDRTNVSLTLLSGSNFPLHARREDRDDQGVAWDRKARLPAYARLDARAQHAFDVKGQRLTAFLEILNVLNRANRGRTLNPPFDGDVSLSEPLFPRLLTAGFRIDLGGR